MMALFQYLKIFSQSRKRKHRAVHRYQAPLRSLTLLEDINCWYSRIEYQWYQRDEITARDRATINAMRNYVKVD